MGGVRRRPVFQKVTKDKYRLVVAQADSITELAQLTGTSLSSVSRAFRDIERCRRVNSAYQITWITLEEGEE